VTGLGVFDFLFWNSYINSVEKRDEKQHLFYGESISAKQDQHWILQPNQEE